MKKIIFVSLLALIIFVPLSIVNAASAGLLISTNKNVFSVGDVFNVQVSVLSNQNVLQLVRAKISYPADLLLVQGFRQGLLFPQKSPGESLGQGIVYVGGYRAGDGTISDGVLGEISFKVIKSGTAQISLISGSRMITPEIKDIYGSGNSITLNLTSNKTEPKIVSAKKNSSLQAPEIRSATNPEDMWEKTNKVSLEWTALPGALGYIASLSQDVKEDIGTELTTKINAITFDNVQDGIRIFQLRAKYPEGLSPIVYYTIKIDSTPPVIPKPVVESKLDSENNIFYQIAFNTTDSTSGVDYYQLSFDNNEFKNAVSPYILSASEKDANLVRIKAVDLAGNESSDSTPVASYIKQHDAKALFDIRAEAAGRSWFEFYITLGLIIFIFSTVVVFFIYKKLKNR